MSTELSSKKKATLLIVDDNTKNIQVIALTLRQYNYIILIATNGKDAVEMVERKRPDLVLLDIMMPGMDGYEACRIIKSKKENDNIPVLFLTALNEKENIVRGFEAGGVDYITKPFNNKELISRVNTHLELKQARDELENTMEHLSRLNSMKNKIFSVIGHDLRSPLGSVKMTLEFLSQEVSGSCSEEYRSTINLMMKTTDEVFNLLENLLGWGKAQTGNLSVSFEDIDLNDLIDSIYSLNKANLDFKDIHFTKEISGETSVFADLNTLKMVFRNLLSNAIKFTPDGGSIKIFARLVDGMVSIAVEDTGVGIPEKNISGLFDPGVHISTYGTNKESGSGLGLKLCYDFIKLNNGDIKVESEAGKGSTFIVTLPAGKEQGEK